MAKKRNTTTRHAHMRQVKSGRVTAVVQHPMKYWGVFGKVKGHSGLGYYKADKKELLGSLDSVFIGTSKTDILKHKKFMEQNIDWESLIEGDKLAEFMIGDMISKGTSPMNAVEVYVNSVEGDTTQLPDKLTAFAKKKGWLKGYK